jgi:drug/metabolite transporter superfamily protein YnfA
MDLRRTIEVSVMAGTAVLEVGGDALIRKGLQSAGILLVVLGFVVLGSYGVLLNLLELDFSRLLGAYVGLFALTSILFGRLVFHESLPPSTRLGLGLVLIGSLVMQFGVPNRSP